MKKSFAGIIAIATMAMVGCTQEEQQLIKIDTNDVFTGIIKVDDSRTTLGENGKIIWSSTDAISIFKKSGYHQKYQVEAGGSAEAKFKYAGESQKHYVDLNKNYAVYPYSINHTITAENEFGLDLSSLKNQKYTENSFENGQSVMTAKSDNTELYFYNALSMIRFKLWSDVPGAYSINKITLTSANNNLNGNAIVDMTNDKPVAVFNGTGERTSILNINEPVVLTEEGSINNGVATGGHDFYILVPAGKYAKEDLTIFIEGEDENGDKLEFTAKYPQNNEGLTLERSAIHTISHVFEEETWTGTIEPIFVSTAEELKAAFETGGKIKLMSDITFDKITSIEPGADAYLDLNGKKITVNENTTSNTLMYVKEGAKLTIDGNGTIDLGNVSSMVIFAPYGELVINNGTFIRNKITTVTDKTTGLFMGCKTTASNVTINGGYFDPGYYDENAADIEEILAGTKTLNETTDDIAKRGNSKDANLVRVALKDNVSVLLNHSGYGSFKIYGGTFVGANPAWGDEGCMLPTYPNYLRPWSYYQGALLDGQTFNENGIVLPTGYKISKGTTDDGRPTYTVSYNK